jgi:PAS domain-containing protein
MFHPTEPLQLHHSWPLREEALRFEQGWILSSAAIDMLEPGEVGALAPSHAGYWECDLADNSLSWTGGIYDIFGLPRLARISRDDAAAFYVEESRAAMEKLRAHAIKHRRGFTLDAQVRAAATGERRWMRLVAAPVCKGGRVTRLRGIKLIL